ncbi:MAG: DUF4350 domain-containing protein, partial [Bacteroidota bacterium]
FLSQNSSKEGTYFFVNNEIQFGETELQTLLDWTSKGNTLFLAARNFEQQLLDTLKLEIGAIYADFGSENIQLHQLAHPDLKKDSIYSFKKDGYAAHFTSIDTLNSRVIGKVGIPSENDSITRNGISGLRQKFGDGDIIISLFPKAFTNYFMLRENNRDYTAGLLSYLNPEKPLFLDNYYKSGKPIYTSPMYLFLNTKEFKWAYYIILIGAVLYVIFEGKRKQRAIPIVRPLKNQTLAFTRTIADMYYEKREQKQIAEHKITYFMDYIRTHFFMDTQKRDSTFYRNLASRSNNSLDEVKDLFSYMDRVHIRSELTDGELKRLNNLIEKFKLKAHGNA